MSINAMFAYNQASQGGKELAEALNIPRIKHVGSKFKGSSSKTILNWGASLDRFPSDLLNCNIINHPNAVTAASNKLETFRRFQNGNVPSPEFTSSKATALEWVNNGEMVFARTQLNAHSGRGIVIMDPEHPDTWEVTAQLYTKYIKKKHEYRVHVCRGQVIDTQRKGLREEFRGQTDVNYKIRNLANGFVYVRNDGHVVPQVVLDAGLAAVTALGLDFGAVDVVYNQSTNLAYALEVNTAPGLTGTTITNYANAIGAL